MEIEAVIFDENQEFFLGQATEDGSKIGLYRCGHDERMEKYEPVVRLVYDFEMRFGRNVTCWEKMFEMDGKEVYAVRMDMENEGLYESIEESDDCILISLSELMTTEEITKDARWMVAMALDTNMRNKIISKI